VRDADTALRRVTHAGATVHAAVREVGDQIRVARVRLPGSEAVLGIIEDPHFALQDPENTGVGPGR
jgi:hypothetical protein